MDYILNTKTGKIHKVWCAKGETRNPNVKLGDRQYYSSITNAKKDIKFKACHINPYCIPEEKRQACEKE